MNEVVKPKNKNTDAGGPNQADQASLSTLAKQFYLQHWGLLLSAALVFAVVINLWPVLAPFVAAFVLAYLLAESE